MTAAWNLAILCGALLLPMPSVAATSEPSGPVATGGPTADDVALSLHIPGVPYFGESPIIIGRSLYMLLCPQDCWFDTAEATLYRVGMDDGVVQVLAKVAQPGPYPKFAADENGIYVVAGQAQKVLGFTLQGKPMWEKPLPSFAGTLYYDWCYTADDARNLYVACQNVSYIGGRQSVSGQNLTVTVGANRARHVFITAYAKASGQPLWTWDKTQSGNLRPDGLPQDLGAVSPRSSFWGLNLVAGVLFLKTFEETEGLCPVSVGGLPDPMTHCGGANVGVGGVDQVDPGAMGYLQPTLWAVAGGKLLWTKADPSCIRAYSVTQGYSTDMLGRCSEDASMVVGNEHVVFTPFGGQMAAMNPNTGVESPPRFDIHNQDSYGFDFGVGMAINGSVLFVRTTQNLYAIDTFTHGYVWQPFALGAGEIWTFGAPLLVDGTLFLASAMPAKDAQSVTCWHLHAFDTRHPAASGSPATLPVLWTANVTKLNDSHWFGLGGGALAMFDGHGRLLVMGQTGASPRPAASPPTALAEKALHVTLGSDAGVLGPTTGYRVVWGDGAASPWQASDAFTHTYAAAGDYEVRLQARNAANQTGSQFVTWHVAAPEQPLNPLQQAFSGEYQNTTFFVIGLAVTAVGAILGVVRVRRRRGIVHEELNAIERLYAQLKDQPDVCETALARRKRDWHMYFLDHRLDEAQMAFLDRRLEEMVRDLRLNALDAGFDFLPHGMVRRLRTIMHDGFVTANEREHFLEEIRSHRQLTRAQRT
ncbi:MAG: PKD domain-containing protein, partial [Thermoplasmatota archaeon]